MKKTTKQSGTTNKIQNIILKSPSLEKYFDILKDKIQPNEKVMIAVSGGSDSMITSCLVYNFFIKYKYNLQNLFFIHCNHGTRNGNNKDEKFVQTFFEGMQLIVAKRPKSEKNTEADLRNRRYKEFKKYTKKYNIKQILFGHNLTDRIESTFLNLLRGANLNGFIAMKEQDSHHLLGGIQILRPILGITKYEVLELCKKNNIPFVTDPTNKDNKTSLRNMLRNKILSKLYTLSNKHNKETNSFIESMKNIYNTLEHSKEKKILNDDFGILNPIKRSPYRNATFAYQRMIDPNKITHEHIMQIIKKLHISSNITTPLLNELKKFLKNSKSGYKYFNNTYIFKSHGNIYIISAPKTFREKTVDKQEKINSLTMKRFPRKGDRYKGKTWNEWCINQKIPIFRRNFIPIIVKNNQIIKIIHGAS